MIRDDAKALAAERWFGYGRWDAPYWFIGMEPGGDDTHASYEAWLALGGGELIDCRAHHQWELETKGIDNPHWTKWHRRKNNVTQSTWRPLIQTLLAFKDEPSDLESVRLYQRDEWGSTKGETAVIELNALHAPNLAATVDREKHRPYRIRTIHERMESYQPMFVVFYGIGYRPFYEQIVGERFAEGGFTRSGDTLCALVPHPARSGKKRTWWGDFAGRLRTATHTSLSVT